MKHPLLVCLFFFSQLVLAITNWAFEGLFVKLIPLKLDLFLVYQLFISLHYFSISFLDCFSWTAGPGINDMINNSFPYIP